MYFTSFCICQYLLWTIFPCYYSYALHCLTVYWYSVIAKYFTFVLHIGITLLVNQVEVDNSKPQTPTTTLPFNILTFFDFLSLHDRDADESSCHVRQVCLGSSGTSSGCFCPTRARQHTPPSARRRGYISRPASGRETCSVPLRWLIDCRPEFKMGQ